MSVFFNGREITSPTTASVINDDAMRNKNLSVGNVAALVGKAAGGKPKTALRFGGPDEAKKVLISGELLDAVLTAFDPSNETGGPQEVVAIRVDPAIQSSLALKDGSNNTVINLLSTNYGKEQNKIKVKVEAGSVSGRRITTQIGQTYYSADNIGRAAFSVQYTGAETSATATINGTSCALSVKGSVVATIDLTEYPTVQELVDRINLVADFDAEVLDNSYTKPALNGLDFITNQDVKTASFTVRADLQAAIDWLNGALEGFVDASRPAGAGAPPAVADFQFMTGGSDGAATYSDWADAYEALQYVDVQWISPVSPNPAIHALNDTHVAYMSNVAMKERRSVCGGDIGTSDEAALAAAKGLNSDRTSFVHLGHYNYDLKGKLTLKPAYLTAAMIVGMFSGVNPGTPLTNKTVKCKGLERDLRNPTDTDVLIKGGVLCLENTEEGYKVVQSISTWLASDNYNRVEQSTGVALDFTARNVRKAQDKLRGQKGNPLLLSRAISITESTLRELARAEPEGPGVLVGDAENPAYRNITASLEGDVLRISYECKPAIGVNYVLNTIYAVPFSGTATA